MENRSEVEDYQVRDLTEEGVSDMHPKLAFVGFLDPMIKLHADYRQGGPTGGLSNTQSWSSRMLLGRHLQQHMVSKVVPMSLKR